jgi:TetR/AcrR family transcriptional regulator, cholesterol catabolism regulator
MTTDTIRTFSEDPKLVAVRRAQIVEGATRLFVKKGYDRTNMRELAKACKMSVGALYYYVGSKEDILYLMFNSNLQETTKVIKAGVRKVANLKPVEAITKFIEIYYKGVDKYQEFILFNYQETKNLMPEAREKILNLAVYDVSACKSILEKGVAAGAFKIKDPLLLAHDIIVQGHMWALRRWYLIDKVTLKDYIRDHTDRFLSSVKHRK